MNLIGIFWANYLILYNWLLVELNKYIIIFCYKGEHFHFEKLNSWWSNLILTPPNTIELTSMICISIIGNILFGKEGVSMQEIINVAKAANAHNFINQQPNGYNTLIIID